MAKHILHYLKEIIDYSILFDSKKDYSLIAYSDADWAGDTTDRKSTTGSLIKIAGGPIYWRSTKQSGVSLSTTEAEYIAASETAKNVIATHSILKKIAITDSTFIFLLLINNIGFIIIFNDEKIIYNAHHINIRYYHI